MREIQASEFDSIAGAGKLSVWGSIAGALQEAWAQAQKLKAEADSGERVPANDEHTNAMGDTY